MPNAITENEKVCVDLYETVIKTDLFDAIPCPKEEFYCKNRQVREAQVNGTAPSQGPKRAG